MSTVTKTYKESLGSGSASTWTCEFIGANITAKDSTFTFTTPTIKAKYVGSGKGYGCAEFDISSFKIGGIAVSSGNGWHWADPTNTVNLIKWASGLNATVTKRTTDGTFSYDSHTKTLNTATFFNSSNKDKKTLNLTATLSYIHLGSADGSHESATNFNTYSSTTASSLGTLATVTLNAPPTCSYTQTSSNTGNNYYAGISTATVTISSLSAKYGGTIKSAVLTIGKQTASRTTNGALSIKLSTAGTFTPTITLTDSRGQTKSYSLNAITVANLEKTTFDCTEVSSSTGGLFAGVSTASVTVSNCHVPLSGSVTNTKLSIGTQSVTGTGEGTLSMKVNTAGTFTPVVSVTDSFGRVSTKNLNAVTVNPYSVPSASFSVERVKSPSQADYSYIGEPDDENGVAGVVTASIVWTSGLSSLTEPSIAVKDNDGATVASQVSWYKTRANNGALSEAITNWNDITPEDMPVYAYIDNNTHDIFNTQYSYQIGITASDAYNSGQEIIQTLAGAYYTIDFLAGGRGIAFGQPSIEEGFFCHMDASFKDKANVMRALFDFMHPVGSYYETSDATFDPNVTWGGRWVLETAGQVHVSAGTGYTIGSTGGNKDAIVPYHKHGFTNPTVTVPKHTHGFTNPKIPNHVHSSGSSMTDPRFCIISNVSGESGKMNVATGNGRYTFASNTSYGDLDIRTHTGNPTSLGSCTGGAVGEKAAFDATVSGGSVGYAGTSGNLTNANMQPYIVVNRWHRTA